MLQHNSFIYLSGGHLKNSLLIRTALALSVVFFAVVVGADDRTVAGKVIGEVPELLMAPFDSAKAKQAQEAWARHLNRNVEFTSSIGMKLRLIPPGEFTMGSAAGAVYEKTEHRVRISRLLSLGVYEVTQQEYERLTGRNPSWFSKTGFASRNVSGLDTTRFPVEFVTWFDAVAFCNLLSKNEQLRPCYQLSRIEREENGSIKSADVSFQDEGSYRLPTEAEWEYACRAGTTSAFFFGEKSSAREANLKGIDPFGTEEKGPYLAHTTDVGSYPANAFGLYDMHGNVWEWCQDWRGDDYYKNSPLVDPRGPDSGTLRIDRGGSWINTVGDGRSWIRSGRAPSDRKVHVGFRVARSAVAN